MIRINQIKLKPDHTEKELIDAAVKKLHLKGSSKIEISVAKKSIDSRHKPDVRYIYSVDVSVNGMDNAAMKKLVQKCHDNDILYIENTKYTLPERSSEAVMSKHPPVIVGMGPAGLFCGLMLARKGYMPVIYERGKDVDKRLSDVTAFWNGGELDTESNVQFGEGGAGTFSDGKLNTMIKDKYGRIGFVLETFKEFGAPAEITYINKPHIGTDILHDVVKNIRNEIIRLGGKVYFEQQVTDIIVKDGKLCGLIINNTKEVPCDIAVFAIGHSARNTFEMLYKRNINMSPKAFAMGVRVEHPQSMINANAYANAPYELPAADYKVTYQTDNKRGVYSFCMCPGGYVVNASSEKGHTCVNGMSYSDRNSPNANSAIVVTVNPSDYGYNSEADYPLLGMEFQRKIEAAAYAEGKGLIPSQTYGDFKRKVKTTAYGEIKPVTRGAAVMSDINNILPEFMCESIIEGMEGFSSNLPGFNREDAVLSAVESRTSSPVRILRNEDFMSNVYGLIPCGEGAGYAGGITSAAIDGIKVFEAIYSKYKGVKENDRQR